MDIMKAYKISLSEGSRELLVALLQANPDVIQEHIGKYEKNDLERENLRFLLDGLKSLPEDERDSPSCLHGLCL